MSKTKQNERIRTITIEPDPKGRLKCFGGADHDDWNNWLSSLVASALPINQKDEPSANKAATAALSGMLDMKPADPIEGIIIAQLMAASQASLSMYHRAWEQPAEYLEARLKYLALADKAARTAMMLTERLDHHRGRGQQKIVVQHVTTNNVTADQALIAESVVTGGTAHTAPLSLTATAETPMPTLDEAVQPVGVGGETTKTNEHQPHAKGSRLSSVRS
jgi:hypothetical protein